MKGITVEDYPGDTAKIMEKQITFSGMQKTRCWQNKLFRRFALSGRKALSKRLTTDFTDSLALVLGEGTNSYLQNFYILWLGVQNKWPFWARGIGRLLSQTINETNACFLPLSLPFSFLFHFKVHRQKHQAIAKDLLQTMQSNIQSLLLRVVNEVRCQGRAGNIQSCNT